MSKLFSQKNLIQNTLITVYILVVLGISATARAEMDILPIFTQHESVATKDFVGEVAMTPNREFFLIVSENEVYKLESNVDLFDYNGQKVSVEGYELKHATGPVANTWSLDPLPGNENKAEADHVLVVFGISGVAN